MGGIQIAFWANKELWIYPPTCLLAIRAYQELKDENKRDDHSLGTSGLQFIFSTLQFSSLIAELLFL